MQRGEEKAAWKEARQNGVETDLWAVVGGKGKKRCTRADKRYLQKLIELKSYKSLTLLQKYKT